MTMLGRETAGSLVFRVFFASGIEVDLHAFSGESQLSNLGLLRGANRSGRKAGDGARRRRERTENEYSPSTILLDKKYQLRDQHSHIIAIHFQSVDPSIQLPDRPGSSFCR